MSHNSASCFPLLLGAATQNEVVDQFHRRVVHFDVEGFDLVGEVVVGPHGRNRDEETERRGHQGFRDTAGNGRQTGRFGLLDTFERVQDADDRAEEADEPMVARAERPRFISAWTMATERSRPRLAASITSASETCCEADWNSERPVATTLAMWLFLLRSAIAIASSSLPSLRAPATCCTNTRDCLRAALYIKARSIMTPKE